MAQRPSRLLAPLQLQLLQATVRLAVAPSPQWVVLLPLLWRMAAAVHQV